MPALLNASGLNSDVAVVGLQAKHTLKGEWSPFLWGSGYQSSMDSLWAALFFLIFGSHSVVLLLSALSLHIFSTCLVFVILKRATASGTLAFLLSLPLVFTTASVHSFALYPPRGISMLFAMLAFFFCWKAYAKKLDLGEKRAIKWEFSADVYMVASAFFSGLSCYADPYAMLVLPGYFLFVICTYLDPRLKLTGENREKSISISVFTLILFVFQSPNLWLRHLESSRNGVFSWQPSLFQKNAKLLWQICGPWALGSKVYARQEGMTYVPLIEPFWMQLFQVACAATFLLGSLFSLLAIGAFLTTKTLTFHLRILALFGLVTQTITMVAFLGSPMVMDHFSMRYLACFILFSPFSFVGTASWAICLMDDWYKKTELIHDPKRTKKIKQARMFVFATLTFLFMCTISSSAYSGWRSFAPYTKGFGWYISKEGSQVDETQLKIWLKSQHVEVATADYWVSYRLTFLWDEDPIVAFYNYAEADGLLKKKSFEKGENPNFEISKPQKPSDDDRYPPYQDEFLRAKRIAYLYDSLRSRETLEQARSRASHLGEIKVIGSFGPFRVFFIERSASPT